MTPDEFTNQEFFLDVGDGYQLYIHEWGNPQAKIPIVVLHGGPGNGCDNRDKKNFDPLIQRVIFHDQRGAGRSTPSVSLVQNTTQDLVEDIEKIADKLSLEKFVLTGGSWGSCLALACGLAYPERVTGMVINGVFTGSQDEMNWLYKGGFRDFFPDVWRQYLDDTPQEHRGDPTAYHFDQALGNDAKRIKQSAYVYQTMELALLKLDDRFTLDDYEAYDPSKILLEMHFAANNWFMEEDYILRNARRLTMPIYMVQGRYDMVCPPFAADKLDQILPNSKLIWSINGHLGQHESRSIQRVLVHQLTETV